MLSEIWNEICYDLKSCIQNNVSEKTYENAVANCMSLLGWKKFKGEVSTQYAVQVGHEKKIADIVISLNDVEQFVIEMKRPIHSFVEADKKQLFSYMRLLNHQVQFGLYIGDKIQLYYDDITTQALPELVFTVDITKDNPDGLTFVKLFSKENYNTKTLIEFCQEQQRILSEQKKIEEEVARILADKEGNMFKELLKNNYLEEGRSEEWIGKVIKSINLRVEASLSDSMRVDNEPIINPTYYRKGEPIINPTYYKKEMTSNDPNSFDYTRYSISGGPALNKRKFVLAVITRYVHENPKTYAEYDRILNVLRSGHSNVIRPLKNVADETRFFVSANELLKSTDGVIFAVNNQWGIAWIDNIVDFANKQGYNVVRV